MDVKTADQPVLPTPYSRGSKLISGTQNAGAKYLIFGYFGDWFSLKPYTLED